MKKSEEALFTCGVLDDANALGFVPRTNFDRAVADLTSGRRSVDEPRPEWLHMSAVTRTCGASACGDAQALARHKGAGGVARPSGKGGQVLRTNGRLYMRERHWRSPFFRGAITEKGIQ